MACDAPWLFGCVTRREMRFSGSDMGDSRIGA
jgi:hypothetical protein